MTSIESSTSAEEETPKYVSGYDILAEARRIRAASVKARNEALSKLPSKRIRTVFFNYLHHYQNVHAGMPEWILKRYVGVISKHDQRVNEKLRGAIQIMAKRVLFYTSQWEDFTTKYPDICKIAFMDIRFPQNGILNKPANRAILSQLYVE